MKFKLMHPREQLVVLMKRLYENKLTNLSGGNLSILDENGDIWITPTGIDKGNLRPEDIMRVGPEGTIEGLHRVTTELPFHVAILNRRPDISAVVHAHTPSLVSFSFIRQAPEVKIIPQAHRICGPIGIAPYAIPGSEQLGKNMADTFAKGYDIVILENHGVAASGKNIFEAVNRLETLAFCATTQIQAQRIGNIHPLSDSQMKDFAASKSEYNTFTPQRPGSTELDLRKQMVRITHRSCRQTFMTSLEGDISTRISENAFLTTPNGKDRRMIEAEDLVLIKDGKRESGKHPGRNVRLHQAIFEKNPDVQCIITTQPPNMMAYAVSDAEFSSRLIPESYVLLGDLTKLPFEMMHKTPEKAAEKISLKKPFAIVENDCLVVVGDEIMRTFDRLEVAEFTAWALIDTQSIGKPATINKKNIQALEKKFLS